MTSTTAATRSRLDAGDDAGEPVAGRLGDDRSIRRRLPALVEEPRDLLDLDEALAAFGSFHPKAALALPPAERLDGDPQHLGSLADADTRGRLFTDLCHTAEYRAPAAFVSRSSARGDEGRSGTMAR